MHDADEGAGEGWFVTIRTKKPRGFGDGSSLCDANALHHAVFGDIFVLEAVIPMIGEASFER